MKLFLQPLHGSKASISKQKTCLGWHHKHEQHPRPQHHCSQLHPKRSRTSTLVSSQGIHKNTTHYRSRGFLSGVLVQICILDFLAYRFVGAWCKNCCKGTNHSVLSFMLLPKFCFCASSCGQELNGNPKLTSDDPIVFRQTQKAWFKHFKPTNKDSKF